MRVILVIPILILAGLGLFALTADRAVAPTPGEYISGASPALRSANAYLLPLVNPAYAPIRDSGVPEPVLDANAATLVHLETGVALYEKNAHVQVPIASLTKLLSALVARDVLNSDDIVVVASSSVRVDGQKQTLYTDERITVRNLISMMLVESSNDAAYALAAHARERGYDFVAVMNDTALRLGMTDCRFTDPAGLDDAAVCTASSVVRLARAALRMAPELWPVMASPEITVSSADGRIVHQVRSTDELLGVLPGIVGGKTGNTDGALGCLLLVVKTGENSDTLISVILGSRSRFTDTRTLVEWAPRGYRWR